MQLLDECLACANKFDIWQYYGTKLSAAAKTCGLDATPKPVDGDASSSLQESGQTSESGAQVSTAAIAPESTSAPSHEPFTAQSTSAVTTPPTSVSPENKVVSDNVDTPELAKSNADEENRPLQVRQS